MPQLKHAKQEVFEDLPSSRAQRRASPAVPGEDSEPFPSPAASLQFRLAEEWADHAGDDQKKWSPRTTLLFCAGASAALWGLIAWVVSAVF